MPGGSEVGIAWVTLAASARGLVADIQKQVTDPAVASAAGQAGEKAGRSFGASLKTGLKMGAAGLAVGIAGMLRSGFDEVREGSAGIAQLEAGIKSTGGVAGVTVDEMEDLASSIQDMSGQTDDSIVAAESLLLTFTNIRNTETDKIFDQATLAAADMAAKMGGDASSNAILLGKALNAPAEGITALTRVGVSFTEAQKDQIKAMVEAGDTAGAQKLILKELEVEFGGAAEAAGKSTEGQVQRGKRAYEDMAQTLTSKLMPAITPLIQAVTGFLKVMGPIMPYLIPLVGIIYAIVAATKVWTVVQGIFNLTMLANPIVWVVAAIAALIAIIVVCIKYHEEIAAALGRAWDAIKGALTAAWGAIKGAFKAAWDFIKGVAQGIWEFLKEWGPTILAVVAPVIGLPLLIIQHWDEIVAWFKDLGGKIKDALAKLWEWITWPFTEAWDHLSGWFSETWDKIADFFKKIPGYVRDGLGALWDAFTGPFKAAWGWINDNIVKPAKEFFSWLTGKSGDSEADQRAVDRLLAQGKDPSDYGFKMKDGKWVSAYESGGFVLHEQLIRAGEQNKPELMLPLSDPARTYQLLGMAGLAPAGGGGMTINGGVTVVANNPREFWREMDRELASRGRGRGTR